VAAYTTPPLTGAERAVSHLISLGYGEEELAIAPRGFEVVERHPLGRRVRAWTKVGCALGIAAGAAVEVERRIGRAQLWEAVVPTLLVGAVVGLALGLVVAVVTHHRGRRRAFGTAPDVVAPHRYEVVVQGDPERARHGLARWWDPSAPPARWQQPA
jgi:hypothetical protein